MVHADADGARMSTARVMTRPKAGRYPGISPLFRLDVSSAYHFRVALDLGREVLRELLGGARDDVTAVFCDHLAHLRRPETVGPDRVQLADDVPRKPGRTEHAEPVVRLELGIHRSHRRQLRKDARGFTRRHGYPLQATGFDVRFDRREGREAQIALAGEERDGAGAAALVRDRLDAS